MKIFAAALVAALFCAPHAFANDAAKETRGLLPEAPHGGILKESNRLNMELVVDGSEIRLYPLSKMGKSVSANQVQVTAAVQSPKKKKALVQLKPMDDHYVGRLDSKAAAPFELKVEAAAKGEEVSFVFQVEPRG